MKKEDKEKVVKKKNEESEAESSSGQEEEESDQESYEGETLEAKAPQRAPPKPIKEDKFELGTQFRVARDFVPEEEDDLAIKVGEIVEFVELW